MLSADVAETTTAASPPRRGRGRWLAIAGVAILAAACLATVVSTHAALSGGFVGWSGGEPGSWPGLALITPAQKAQYGVRTSGYSEVLWASRPGGELFFGFDLHNGGLVPVTILGLKLKGFGPGVINDLAPAGAQLGPGKFGGMRPFHPVTIGPGASLPVALIERVVCDPTVRSDARTIPLSEDTSVFGDATSPVLVRYRALGISTSQTLSLATPVLVMMPYIACR